MALSLKYAYCINVVILIHSRLAPIKPAVMTYPIKKPPLFGRNAQLDKYIKETIILHAQYIGWQYNNINTMQ